MSMVRNGMVLLNLQNVFTWLAGILTDFYYKELIKIDAKLVFLFGTGPNTLYVRDIGKLILEGRFLALMTLYKVTG